MSGAVVKPAGLLHPGTAVAAHVDFGAGQGGGAAAGAGQLERHLGAGIGGLDNGAGAGAAQADDDHICFPVPVCNVTQFTGLAGLVLAVADMCLNLLCRVCPGGADEKSGN